MLKEPSTKAVWRDPFPFAEQIRNLIVEKTALHGGWLEQQERHLQRTHRTVRELPRLISLTFLFHKGCTRYSIPILDYSSLMSLRRLNIRGDAQFGGHEEDEIGNTPCGVSQSVTDVSFHGRIWMISPHVWLSNFASTVRRLELTGVRTAKCVADLIFPELETLEYHWCSTQLLKGAQFPSLKYYAESLELGPNFTTDKGCRTPLFAVQGYVDQLRLLVLRGEYCQEHRDTRPLLNIGEVIARIQSAKDNGSLKAAFIEGSFSTPLQREPWLKYLGPIDYDHVQHRAEVRLSILKEVDPKCRFSETRSNAKTHLGAMKSWIDYQAWYGTILNDFRNI